MEAVVVLVVLLVGYYFFKLYQAKQEILVEEAKRVEGLQVATLEALDELSRRYESDDESMQDYWVNLSDVLTEWLDRILKKKEEELDQKEANFVSLLKESKTNKTNQIDVFNKLFDFLLET